MLDKDAARAGRPEIHKAMIDSSAVGVVEKPLSTLERLYGVAALRRESGIGGMPFCARSARAALSA